MMRLLDCRYELSLEKFPWELYLVDDARSSWFYCALVLIILLSGSGNCNDNWQPTISTSKLKAFLSYSCLDKKSYIPPDEPFPFICQVKPEKKLKANYSESCCDRDMCNDRLIDSVKLHRLSLLPDTPGKHEALSLLGSKMLTYPDHLMSQRLSLIRNNLICLHCGSSSINFKEVLKFHFHLWSSYHHLKAITTKTKCSGIISLSVLTIMLFSNSEHSTFSPALAEEH